MTDADVPKEEPSEPNAAAEPAEVSTPAPVEPVDAGPAETPAFEPTAAPEPVQAEPAPVDEVAVPEAALAEEAAAAEAGEAALAAAPGTGPVAALEEEAAAAGAGGVALEEEVATGPAEVAAPDGPDLEPSDAVAPAAPDVPAETLTPAAPQAGGDGGEEPAAPTEPDVPAEALTPAAPQAGGEAPAAGAPQASGEAPAASAPQAGGEAPAAGAPQPGGGDGGGAKKRRRKRGGGKVAEAWGLNKTAVAGVEKVDLRSSGEGVTPGNRPTRPPGRPGAKRGSGGPRAPRVRGELPFQELRDAAQAMLDIHGPRTVLRDAFPLLAAKERNDLSQLVSDDGDFRKRARSIAAGSLGAGNLSKALAAQTVAISNIQDLWQFTLSKEEAAARLAWVRRGRQRDEQRAKRAEERSKSADRVSREDMAKAQDGRIGPQIRIVVAGEESKRERRPKKEKKGPDPKLQEILDRMGY